VSPNFLIFAPDDLGREYLSPYAVLPQNLQIPTPNIARLAQNGITYTRAYSQPWCSPTRASWMTGRYGFQTGIGSLAEGENQPLLDTEVCLPYALKAATDNEYACAGFGKWHLSNWTTPGDVYQQPARVGFDLFEGHLRNIDGGETYEQWEAFSCVAAKRGSAISTKRFAVNEWSPRWLADRAAAWINEQSGPWLTYFPINLPHTPYNRPPEYAYDTDLYDLPDYRPSSATAPSGPTYFKAMTQALDWSLGYLLSQIPQHVRSSTYIIFWSDNGTAAESFDTTAKTGVDLTAYLGSNYTGKAKRTVYQIGVDVPLIISGPRAISPGRTSSALVSPADLFRTIISLAGGTYGNVPLPPSGTRPSVDFSTTITQGATTASRSYVPIDLFSPNGPNINCSTSGSRKLAYPNYTLIRNNSTGTSGFPSGTGGSPVAGIEFYNVATDPNETTNLIGTGPINLNGATLTAYNQAVADYATAFSTL
jgi:arylsulfatase A-like enzyme